MEKQLIEGDRLFLIAENLAQDFSLFPTSVGSDDVLPGLLTDSEITRRAEHLQQLDIDSYIESVVAPAESQVRPAAPGVIRELGEVTEEASDGPFYSAVVMMDFDGGDRLVGFIAQDRSVENGMWGPSHHMQAAKSIERYATRSIPIVTLMDTPGADSREDANANNQAHSISRLIAEASNVDVPNVGIVFGIGYSGGAIPLAASNMILSVRDGVFSTIQPPGLASIARRLNLSWQECAKYVGLSPYELYTQGNIDGVIDYSPMDPDSVENLRRAIIHGLVSIETVTKAFVAENPYILDHYRQSIRRYLNPSTQLQAMQASAALKLTKNPTEYLNVFGVAYRYLRYLKVRQRIHSTSLQQYGRLADRELPTGELQTRANLERRRTFLKWLQDPDKVVYDETLTKAWRNYNDKKQAVHDERGRIAQLIFGEPRKNYEQARDLLIATVGVFLYNRWKAEAPGNLRALKEFLHRPDDTRLVFQTADISNPVGLVQAIRSDAALLDSMRDRFTHEGKKLLREGGTEEKSEAYLANQLTSELNLVLTGGELASLIEDSLTPAARALVHEASEIRLNRQILTDRYTDFITAKEMAGTLVAFSEMTVLELLVNDELREDFIIECENLLIFDSVYDQVIANLDTIAEEAQGSQSISRDSMGRLVETTLSLAAKGLTIGSVEEIEAQNEEQALDRLRTQVLDWYRRIIDMPKGSEFFRTVEEWKKTTFSHLSDTLFVVVTYLFESLLSSYIQAETGGRSYQGRIAPKNIGRRKDFWYRLNLAYRDLLMQNVLRRLAAKHRFSYDAFVDAYFSEWEEKFGDLLSSDPCQFPGFRISIEDALNRELPPCGVVTGFARFKRGEIDSRVGLVVSNTAFQAGSFDMASAEKVCKMLVECAEAHLPVVCFISSGGMQTKEGAGALFSMAAVNDRITRFVRDHDLPVIVFGYGNCTGGAQASFVTHPLAQTYYLSGTSMPFAGQIVVPSNLPLNSILSNYLSPDPESMQGLVKHPFQPELDDELRKIDAEIPIPEETVPEVIERVLSGVLSQERPVVVAHRPHYTDADLVKPVRRVLVHARGCTAAKLIRIAQAREHEVVLVQSDPDMESAAVDQLTERDTLVCIGGNTPDESYLNAMSVMRVAEQEGVDALHPGIGFLSENSQFAELVRSHGINFIGPPVSSMETMGNKSNAINTALRLDVPVVPGSHGILTNVDRAAEVALDIGYPVLIKAVHGGGGKGIQVVESAAAFHELFHQVRAEARAAFGNGDVYLEKYITSLRHIEVQLLRDTHGNTRVLGLRDCSVQRDKQKVFEESGSTMLPAHLEEAVFRHTAAIANEVGYVGAGTVEFIYDLASDAIYFMEMNTRLQVEHPVTEWVSGVDIVGEQFRIASGESIESVESVQNGCAIEARITAERIEVNASGQPVFRPQPGEIREVEFPQEEGVEIIAAVTSGKSVSPYYDSMVAQVIVHAADRNAAIDKLAGYISRIRLSGINTNIALLKRVLADEVFRNGEYDTNYLPEFLRRTDVETLISEAEEEAGERGEVLSLESIQIEDSDELKVLAPANAIFYSTPSPTEPEFVAVGDKIGIDTTLCQLEAMKIFSPLALKDFNTEVLLYEGGREYEVTRINMSNGQQVNKGNLLFVVKPLHRG
ncbi:MAG: biotin carboxylase N-terminal domain-containing protein [Pseudomonadales bacterium]|nr:biotin carboxylase N-terminal domain-containing protein [Pseudomonadales bacterium]MDP6471606.1 biotin carboxylase N-terminal domain-containing protein [Pseudomonadales bacterium]MDP6828869.1 biotin carboxylase N-terminal domain-containing protein [Pseudomonadales bacterium]MDP6970599.1 biotin carboxylase N-terminal domain-containing protein [Pseudomonadales bacterium]